MGLKHEAKKGTVIEVNGVKIVVLRGSPLLEVTAPPGISIKTGSINGGRDASAMPNRTTNS